MGAPPFAHGPAGVRQPGSHRWRALLPRPGRPGRGTLPQTLVQPADMVGTPAPPHPSGQPRRGGGQGPPPPHQGRHRRAKGSVQPLAGGGRDPRPAVGGGHHRREGRRGPGHPAVVAARHPTLPLPLAHVPQPPALRQIHPRPPATAGAPGVAEHVQEGRHSARQSLHAHQDGQAAAAGPDPRPQRGEQAQGAVGAEDAPQPAPRRHGHGHGHPHPAAHPRHPAFVRLHVLQVHLALVDQVLMQLLAVMTCPGKPGGDGPLIQAKGGDACLRRAAMAQQGEYKGDQICGGPQAVEGCTRRGREGVATDRPPLALLHSTMHPNIPLPHLSSGLAVRIVAELGLRVHRWPPSDAIFPTHAITSPRMPEEPAFFQAITRLTTVTWGATAACQTG